MSSKRAPSPPPLIDGFEYVSVIGSGGFSDVFLYQQQRPRRRVAVKVLLHEWSSESQRAAFDVEADLMATLSTHPSIVTMYEADVASDGRPYLAMEYCPRPNLGARYRSERLSVAETLRIAVQIAGAVETAHRSGILHRDIKPANILVTEYGHPVLTDFGISSTMDDASRAEGMSIPWSPPESFAENPWAGRETDVWALAATTYTLLAGRAPFELPGGSNSSASLITRIESTPLLPTGRTDVPASLERVLGTAMAKNPASRYPSTLAFARALQQVQNELSYAVTPIDVLADAGLTQEDEPDDDGGTRLRAMVSIDPRGTGGGQGGSAPGAAVLTGRSTTGTAPVVRSDPQQVSHDPHGLVTSSGRSQVPTGPGIHQGSSPAVGYAASAQAPAPVGYVPARPAPGPRAGEAPAASGWGVPVEDTVHRVQPRAAIEPEPQEEAARRPRWPLLVAAGVLLLVVVGVFFLLPDGTVPGPDAGAGTTQGEEPVDVPNDNLGDLVPQVVGIETWYDAGQGAATFEVELPSDWKEGTDVLAIRRVDDPLVTNPFEDTPFTRIAVEAPESERVCLEIVVKREGKMSEPTRGCVPE